VPLVGAAGWLEPTGVSLSDHPVRSGSGQQDPAFGAPRRAVSYRTSMAETMADAQTTRRDAIRRLLTVAAVLVTLLILTGVPGRAVDAIRPPDLFRPGFGVVGTSIPSMPVGETLLVRMSNPDEAVTLEDAKLIVDPDSALSAVQLVACQRREGRSALGSTVGSKELTQYCETVHRPTEVEVGGPTTGHETYLLAVVQPLEPGRILIEGLEVTHSRGPLHRTERTGDSVEIVAS